MSVTIGSVELETKQEKSNYIPSDQAIIGQEEKLEQIAWAIKENLPVLMIGETGSGKTSMIRSLAAKTRSSFRRLNLNGQTTTDEFVGKMLLNKQGTYWQDGVLIEAMREGHWLLLDEINAALPEILFVLHSLLDDDGYVVLSENDGEIVRPHPNFRLFATMNPSGKYAGTKQLNKAFLSRFPVILQQDFPSKDKEIDIVGLHSSQSFEVVENLVKMANDLRESYFKNEIEFICSTRDLINTSIIADGLGISQALELAILNRAEKEDIKAVRTVVQLYFGESGKPKKTTNYQDSAEALAGYCEKLAGDTDDIGYRIKEYARYLEKHKVAKQHDELMELADDMLEYGSKTINKREKIKTVAKKLLSGEYPEGADYAELV